MSLSTVLVDPVGLLTLAEMSRDQGSSAKHRGSRVTHGFISGRLTTQHSVLGALLKNYDFIRMENSFYPPFYQRAK